ncbi:MAG: hypothetical protein IKT81_00680 [Clostridia bacterium]|nr:hypothetical protein [Clostridia bacterium]MBR4955544.1 hypothetical protein [Clostridia bacterium]
MKFTKTARLFERFAPPGMPLKSMSNSVVGGSIISAFWALLIFLIRYWQKYDNLFYTDYAGVSHLYEGAVMPDFGYIFGDSLMLFNILALSMVGFIVYFYAYYYRGGKSIYTMRRLPNRWEIHKRSIVLPLLAVITVLAAAFVMVMICFGLYMIFTPDQCLTPDQWSKLWREIL